MFANVIEFQEVKYIIKTIFVIITIANMEENLITVVI